jgi:hypothetical protein
VRHTQLSESPTSTPVDIRALHSVGEHFDDLVVSPEVGEVLERQVDRTDHRAGAAQVAKLVGLSLSDGHATTIHPRADAPLHSD